MRMFEVKVDWKGTAKYMLSDNVVVSSSLRRLSCRDPANHANLCSLGEERGEGNIKERGRGKEQSRAILVGWFDTELNKAGMYVKDRKRAMWTHRTDWPDCWILSVFSVFFSWLLESYLTVLSSFAMVSPIFLFESCFGWVNYIAVPAYEQCSTGKISDDGDTSTNATMVLVANADITRCSFSQCPRNWLDSVQ